jgi:peptidyl-prolyl cis-trans isomerase D
LSEARLRPLDVLPFDQGVSKIAEYFVFIGVVRMIKLLREAAHDYPWFLKSIMGLLALAFVITMGWWGFGQQTGNIVASVGDQTIQREEYLRAKENVYRFFKEKGQNDVKEEMLQQMVIDQLVDNRMWSIAAKELGITVSDEDLRSSILEIPQFHNKEGAFDPELYRRTLAVNRWTPATFEAMQAKDLLVNKTRMVIMDAVALTPAEVSEAQALMTREGESDPAKAAATKERIFQNFLFQKQQRALAAYTESLKTKITIKVHKELL